MKDFRSSVETLTVLALLAVTLCATTVGQRQRGDDAEKSSNPRQFMIQVENLREKNGAIDLEFSDLSGRISGEATIWNDPDYGVQVLMQGPRVDRTQFSWDPERGIVNIQNHRTGESSGAYFDFQRQQWVIRPGSEDLFKQQRAPVELAASILEGFEKESQEPSTQLAIGSFLLGGLQYSKRKTTEKPTEASCNYSADPQDSLVGPPSNIPCGGPWVRAWTIGITASICCESVRNQTAVMCMNSMCWGCCYRLGCDTACLSGDLMCYCGMSGQRCSLAETR